MHLLVYSYLCLLKTCPADKPLQSELDNTCFSCDDPDNLNVKIPSPNEIDTIIDSIAEVLQSSNPKCKGKKSIIKSAIAKYYYNNLQVCSQRKLSALMKTLYEEIQKNIPENASMDDVIFIIPNNKKSFLYITRQFASANNIPMKNIASDDCSTINEIEMAYKRNPYNGEKVYSDKIIVSVDDIAASGASILSDAYKGLGYDEKISSHSNKYIFARLFTTNVSKALIDDRIKEISKKFNLSSPDSFVYSEIIQNHDNEVSYTKEEKRILEIALSDFATLIGPLGYSQTGSGIVFPVMAPDNNSGLMEFIISKFLPNKYCIKNPISNYDLKHRVLEQINKNLY